MPTRVPWDPTFCVDDGLIDAQHQALLAQCNALADLCPATRSEDTDRQFDQALDRLKALAREHFATEGHCLAGRAGGDLDDHRVEREEFEYLANHIATTEHFDRLELQRFLTLWCLGHLTDAARRKPNDLASGNVSA